ncbi:MAG: HYR domain-containing protein [Saprospiraceae bacterium]|nr:MAG: Hyalin repeat-containing protein [Bacteroidetes bacterium OLB9]MCO6463390.1 HYR domain-containing protein [Saprospiraceae bacterium]
MSILHKFTNGKNTLTRHIQRLVLMMLFFVVLGTVSAQNRYVSTTGDDTANDCSNLGSPCATIQHAVNQAVSGDNINVAPGTYNENVNINKSVQLLGSAMNSIVQGSTGQLGTFWIPNGTNNVSIDGFTLIGYDNANGAIEYAALYIQSNNQGITITNNRITANGEGGLLTEYGGTNSNLIVTGNIFDGQTFTGPNPGACGFSTQFDNPTTNVPRQLVVVGPSYTNVTFTNNTISGTAGGVGTVPPCDVTGQGNTLVTIDATNTTISGNTFNGKTSRFASMLRTRGTQNSIFNNNFDASNLEGLAFFHFYDSDALTGGSPDNLPDLLAQNQWSPNPSYVVDGSGNTSILFCDGPILRGEIDGNASTSTSNDGISEVISIDYCDDANVGFSNFADIDNIGAEGKLFQIVESTNVTHSMCNNCVRDYTDINGSTENFTLTDPSQQGTLTLKFISWEDTNDDDLIDLNECRSDTLIFNLNLYPTPVVTITSDNTPAVCVGAVINYQSTVTGGIPGASYTYNWCAFNSPSGSGTCFTTGFTPNNTDPNPSRQWNFLGGKSVQLTVNTTGCAPVLSNLLSFEVFDQPAAPTLDVATPSSGTNVCIGDVMSATTNPGTGGANSCSDEYQYSTDNGVTWQPYVPGNNIIMDTSIVIIQGRRVCNGTGCDATDWEDIATWNSASLPTVAITPDPAIGCPLSDINLNGNPSGGTTPYTHLWTGLDADKLDDVNIQTPVFNHDAEGSYTVNYIVTDDNGCIASDNITITLIDDEAPSILCPANIEVVVPPTECTAVVNYADPVVTDNCPGALTWSVVSGLSSGSDFPIGTTTVVLEATDHSGNTATCSFTVTVNDILNPNLACGVIQHSLDGNCEGVLSPLDVLTGWEESGGSINLGCLDAFQIDIMDINGISQGNHLNGDNIGQTLKGWISHPNVGVVCDFYVKVEDKIAPTIECDTIDVPCLTDVDALVTAQAFDNCFATVSLVDHQYENLDCDPDYIGRITRIYRAIDGSGNESGTCTSIINISRPNSAGITLPVRERKFLCSDNFRTDDRGEGFPAPEVVGVPVFDGQPLWPQSNLEKLYCNAFIDYEDQVITHNSCRTRILRIWTITEWWCSESVVWSIGNQMIDIVDEEGPSIPQQNNFEVTTQARTCSAVLQLPQLNITDKCNTIKKVFVNITDGVSPIASLASNGGFVELPVGIYSVTYTAIDHCGNSSTMTYRITVKDDTQPIAVCDEFATVSLRQNGYTYITANAVDDGSYDACGDVTLKISRMDGDPCDFGYTPTVWKDTLQFCCLDSGTSPMVALLVTDKGGNTNMCMVSVQVQDKILPSMTCPEDVTVECTFTFDPSDSGMDRAFGTATIFDNCPSNPVVRQSFVDNRSNCGIGTIQRTLALEENGDTIQTCLQTITFINSHAFTVDSIVWPKDTIIQGQCAFDGLSPENLPDGYNNPIISEGLCDLIGVRYEDEVNTFTTNGACYKILRKWKVLDWCQSSGGVYATWTHTQEIAVMDNNAPIMTVPDSLVVFETAGCTSAEVTLGATATDCTPSDELVWTYKIYQDSVLQFSGNSNVVIDTFEVGSYYILFTVRDRCGNISEAGYDFEIKTVKAPTAICKKGLAASLVLMDTNGDGTGDTPQVMLRPDFFDNKSEHLCGVPFVLSFSADTTDTLVTFDCDDLGNQTIQLWVTDTNGNTNYCETFVDIQDNDTLCGGTGPLVADISGRTVKEDNQPIENVTVELQGNENVITNTNQDGRYTFSATLRGQNYDVVPSRVGDDMNGVSTLDLVMIQRHILGLEHLNSPYKLIAADANNNGSISAADVSELRKLILGVNPTLTNNTSWRFVDAAHKFVDVTNPWTGGFPEIQHIDNLRSNMDMNFIGIKIGDVNGSAVGTKFGEEVLNTRTLASLAIEDRIVHSGEIIEIPVIATSTEAFYGLQAALQTEGLILREMKGGVVNVTLSDYAIKSVKDLKLALADGNGINVKSGDVLFSIEVEAIKDGKLSEMMALGNELSAELYGSDMEATPFGLQWRTKHVSEFGITAVAPNPWSTNTEIKFELPKAGVVAFSVKDYTGKSFVSTIQRYEAGENTIRLNRSDIPHSGVYIYEVKFGTQILTGKMIVIE